MSRAMPLANDLQTFVLESSSYRKLVERDCEPVFQSTGGESEYLGISRDFGSQSKYSFIVPQPIDPRTHADIVPPMQLFFSYRISVGQFRVQGYGDGFGDSFRITRSRVVDYQRFHSSPLAGACFRVPWKPQISPPRRRAGFRL